MNALLFYLTSLSRSLSVSDVFLSMARCQDEQLVVLSHQLFRCYDPNPNLDGMVCSYALVYMTCVCVCVCASVHMTCLCARARVVCVARERARERRKEGRQAGRQRASNQARGRQHEGERGREYAYVEYTCVWEVQYAARHPASRAPQAFRGVGGQRGSLFTR
jgi:hypothetical protein